MDLGERLASVDEMCVLTRILRSASRIEEWLFNYDKSYLQSTHNFPTESDMAAGPSNESYAVPDWMPQQLDGLDWSLPAMGNDGAFGLEELFNDPFDFLSMPSAQFLPTGQNGSS